MSLFIMLLFLLFFRFSKENRGGKIMFHSCLFFRCLTEQIHIVTFLLNTKNQRIQEKITTLNILANLQSDSSSSSSDDDPIVDDTNQDEPSQLDYHQYIIV